MAFTVFNSIEEWASHSGDARRTAITVGNFDGLHLGHQKILHSVRERARATG
jgi:FAD synthase